MPERYVDYSTYESELAEALAYTRLLQSISLQLVADQPIETMYECLAAAASTLLRSDFASMQMLYPERNGGQLRLLAHRGFTDEAAAALEWVGRDAATSCAEVMRTGQRVIVPDVEASDMLRGTAVLDLCRRLGIRAKQSTPLYSRDGELVGMLSTHWRDVHAPSERELTLLDILARQAADLLERRRAAAEVRAAHDTLEQTVVQRTSQVRDLLRRLVNSQEEERRRIAREIHDEVGQQMTALRINIELLAARPSPEQATLTLDLAEALDHSIDFLAWQLRPGVLEQSDLASALTSLVAQWSSRFGIPTVCRTEPINGIRFDRDVEANVYRVVQEALHNVYKHARATLVDVRVKRRDDHVVVEVSDDGCGFVSDDMTRDPSLHIGVIGMRERAAMIDGVLRIQSSPGRGATVSLRVPLPAAS